MSDDGLGARILGAEPLLAVLTLLLAALFVAVFAPTILSLDWLLLVTAIISMATTVFFFLKPQVSLLIFFSLRAILDLLWWLPASVASMNPSEAFSGAVAGLAMILFFMVFRRFDRHPCAVPFVIYFVFMCVSGLRAVEFRDASEILARYLSTFFIMFVGSEYFSTRKLRFNVVLLTCAVGIVPVGVSLYHLATGQMSQISLAGLPRLIGGYKNLPNPALMVMYFSIMGTFWVFATRHRVSRALAITFAGSSILCMYLTYVRTAWLGYAIFFAIFLWLEGHRRLLLIVGVAAMLAIGVSPLLQQRFADFLIVLGQHSVDYDMDQLGSDRLGIWLTALRAYNYYGLADKLLGLGAGRHLTLTARFSHMYLSEAKDTHNDFLSLLFQMGPFALFAYWAMQFQVLRYALKLRQLTTDRFWRSFGAMIIGIDICQFWANSISNAFIHRTTIGWYFWGLAGVLFAEVKALQLRSEPESGTPLDADAPRELRKPPRPLRLPTSTT